MDVMNKVKYKKIWALQRSGAQWDVFTCDQTGRWLQSVPSETEMEGQDVLDTVWLIYKCFTLGGGSRVEGAVREPSTQESITGVFSYVTSNRIKHAITIAQKRCHRLKSKTVCGG